MSEKKPPLYLEPSLPPSLAYDPPSQGQEKLERGWETRQTESGVSGNLVVGSEEAADLERARDTI